MRCCVQPRGQSSGSFEHPVQCISYFLLLSIANLLDSTGAKPYKCTESGCKFECGSASHLVHHHQRKHGHLKTRVSSMRGSATQEAETSRLENERTSTRGRSLPPALPSRSRQGMPDMITDSRRGLSTPPYVLSQTSGLYDTPSPQSSVNWASSSTLPASHAQEQSPSPMPWTSPAPGPHYTPSPSLPSSSVSTPRSDEWASTQASPSEMLAALISTPPHEDDMHHQEQSSYIDDMLGIEPDVFFASQPLKWNSEGGC